MNKLKILLIDDNVHLKEKAAPLFKMERDYLIDQGHKVTSIGFSKNIESNSSKFFIIREKKGRLNDKITKFIGDRETQSFLRELIDEIKPDIIHCHLLAKHALNVYKVIPKKIKVVQSLHGPNFFCATGWGCVKKDSRHCDLGISNKCVSNGCVSIPIYLPYKKLNYELQKLLKEKVNVFHCPSRQIEKVANSHGFKNTVNINLGLRNLFTDYTNPHGVYGTQKIIFVGSMNPVKGIDYLIDSFNQVLKKFPNSKLYMAGRGSHLDYYKKIVINKGLSENIIFLGYLTSKDLIDLYSQSDVCVVPSIWSEQFGMVGPEALSCGVPVIGSDIGGIPEWLSKDYGWLVPPRNVDKLTEAIIEAISDPKNLLIKGVKARKVMRSNYMSSRYCSQLLELFQTI